MSTPTTLDHALFRQQLGTWFDAHARELPWRTSTDPWAIWLSEVILQQTRVDQGLDYFNRFLSSYPTVTDLANAPLDDVLRLWEGLGYYSRARNLHRAAQLVRDQMDGVIPETFEGLLELPGVGAYTAAAIASIAFGEPAAVVDGNVIRVITRLVALNEIPRRAQAKRTIQSVADALLDPERPGPHNEAMMELGAMICSPRSPSCDQCPVASHCVARSLNDQEAFPRKAPKKTIPHVDISVGVITNDEGRIFIQRRPQDAMLGGLWEFPGGKVEPGESDRDACVREIREEINVDVDAIEKLTEIQHAYSHFRITMHAWRCIQTSTGPVQTQLDHAWIAREQFADYAFPRANRKLLDLLSSLDS